MSYHYQPQQQKPPNQTYWTQNHVIGLILAVGSVVLFIVFLSGAPLTLGLSCLGIPFAFLLCVIGILMMIWPTT